MNPGRPPRWTLLAGAVLLLAVVLVLIGRRHDDPPSAAVPGGNGGVPGRPVGSTAAIPGPVPQSDLAQAKTVAGKYVQAAHALDYRTISATSRLTATRPYMTSTFYQRAKARSEAADSAGDRTYVTQLREHRIRVFVTVRSAAVASGDGDAVTTDHLQMRVYYTTNTISDESPDGTVSPEMPTTVSLRKTSKGWLVDGADGT